MKFVRERFVLLCLLSFLVTSGFGVILALWPDCVAHALGAPQLNTFFARMLGAVLMVMGLAYVLVLIYDEAKSPLLVLATLEKTLAVLYVLTALFKHQIHWPGLGMLIVDAAIVVFGVLALTMPEETSAA